MQSFPFRLHTVALIAALILSAVLFAALPVLAAPSASLGGSDDVRAGDTVSLTFAIQGEGLSGVTCSLVYNEAQLILQDIVPLISDPWMVESAGNNIIAYDNELSSPISGHVELFRAIFKVKGTLEPGTEVRVSADKIITSDGSLDQPLPEAVWSTLLGLPRSSDATLSTLQAAEAVFAPGFLPSLTAYAATVPYSVTSLSFTVTPTHPAATYKITGNQLKVGKNEIQIRVSAEDGSQRTYTLTVTREQDPNYIPSSDAALSSLSPSIGALSPSFAPDTLEYVLYLPYEAESLTLSGTARHALGNASGKKTHSLALGENQITYLCHAEDGSEQAYLIRAVRMPPYSPDQGPILPPTVTEPTDTSPPETPPPDTDPPVTHPVTTEPTPTIPSSPITEDDTQTGPSRPNEQAGGVPPLLVVLIGLLGVGIGFGGAIVWARWQG